MKDEFVWNRSTPTFLSALARAEAVAGLTRVLLKDTRFRNAYEDIEQTLQTGRNTPLAPHDSSVAHGWLLPTLRIFPCAPSGTANCWRWLGSVFCTVLGREFVFS